MKTLWLTTRQLLTEEFSVLKYDETRMDIREAVKRTGLVVQLTAPGRMFVTAAATAAHSVGASISGDQSAKATDLRLSVILNTAHRMLAGPRAT
jgi:hypothetical protein